MLHESLVIICITDLHITALPTDSMVLAVSLSLQQEVRYSSLGRLRANLEHLSVNLIFPSNSLFSTLNLSVTLILSLLVLLFMSHNRHSGATESNTAVL